MNSEAIQAAAHVLVALRLRSDGTGAAIDDLPAACRPADLAQAFAVQAAVTTALQQRGHGPTVGWKIGCTTQVMQDYLGIAHPCAGRLYAPTVRHGSARLLAGSYFQLGLECEIAVQLGDDLPGRPGGHDRGSVAAAVSGVMASVEVVEHRFVDFSRAAVTSLVADDFFSAGCVFGEPRPLDAVIDDVGDLADLRGGFRIDGAAGPSGTGSAILGHPLNALAWLADHAAAVGLPLQAGEYVTLGSVVKTIYPAAGCRVEACFDGLAPVVIDIA